MAGSTRGPFKVVAAGMMTRDVRDIASRAVRREDLDLFLDGLREIYQQLATGPVTRGDQVKTYPAAGLDEYHYLHEGLSVRYAVDVLNRIVYVKGCKAVLKHPLAGQ